MERKYPRSVTDLLRLLDSVEYVAEPPRELLRALRLTLPDPGDVPVLAGAVYAGAEVLVTGDRRHFGELYGRNVGGCVVLPPREALSLLESRLEG